MKYGDHMKNIQDSLQKLQTERNEYVANLEVKHKNLRDCICEITAQLRALEGPYDEEQESTTSWPEVSSFGIYMQLLQALMGAVPPKFVPKPEAKESRKKKFKVLG